MRIFLASIGMRSPIGERALWAVNIREPLVAMGHDVVDSSLDWDCAMAHVDDDEWQRDNRSIFSQKLVDEVQIAHHHRPIDLFFSYLYSAHVDPAAIKTIRALGIPAVNFFCNAAHQYHLVEEIAPAFDYCWVPERQALPAYKRSGAKPLHIQMGANPAYYRPISGVEKDIPVAFAGSLYADRSLWLSRIYKQGIPMQIFTRMQHSAVPRLGEAGLNRSLISEALKDVVTDGPMYLFRRAARSVSLGKARNAITSACRPRHPDLADLFCRSQIVLNLSNVFDGGRPGGRVKAHVRLREFEVPLCRSLLFPQYCAELEDYYDLDREVIGWKTVEEVCDKVRYYLAHPADADRVREAGYRRALSDHTAEKRFRQLFVLIGLSKAAP